MRKDFTILTFEQLFKARLHLGHHNKHLNKSMITFILGNRHNINILNLEKIIYNLTLIFNSISTIIAEKGFFFLIGTNKNLPMKTILTDFLEKYNISKKNNFFLITGFSIYRWVGGIFSNWRITFDFIKHMLKPTSKKDFRYAQYLDRLQGIDILNRNFIPDIVISFDNNLTAFHEINNLDIPIIGISDSNVNHKQFLYTFVGNDDSIESINFFCMFLEEAIKNGKLQEQEQFLYYFINKLKKEIN